MATGTMNDAHLLQELEAAASELSVEVRREDLEGSRGGLCRVRGQDCILVDQRLSVSERIGLMTDALSRLPLDDVFLRPAVRELLEGRCADPADSAAPRHTRAAT
jgi:hypothetical protein